MVFPFSYYKYVPKLTVPAIGVQRQFERNFCSTEIRAKPRQVFCNGRAAGIRLGHAMVQCRNYLYSADCIAFFTAAESLIRNSSAANGANVVYLGCSLRWVSQNLASDNYNSQSDHNLQAVVPTWDSRCLFP